jgi:dTDP-4-amino-4,6-dideoxygalactose transaminase
MGNVISPPVKYPFLRPDPPRLSRLGEALMKIESSGIYSNYGPTNQELERRFIETLFGGIGHCLTVCNATIGLVLAVRHVIDRHFGPGGGRILGKKYAILPAFTFAATAHAAIWNNLIPLFCDIDRNTWQPSLDSQEELLRRFAGETAVLIPYATFGANLDLSALSELSSRYDVPVVVDAAASLGSLDAQQRQFGAGFMYPLAYSMHVTKAFSTGEAGLVYCNDGEVIAALRCMGNFGFGEPRSATMPGLNSKLSEIGALLGLEKLNNFGEVVTRRHELAVAYRQHLPELIFQRVNGPKHVLQFMPTLIPTKHHQTRDQVVAQLAASGIIARTYFSPHLAEQSYFQQTSKFFELPVTREIADRIISLPMYDGMTSQDVQFICETLRGILKSGNE